MDQGYTSTGVPWDAHSLFTVYCQISATILQGGLPVKVYRFSKMEELHLLLFIRIIISSYYNYVFILSIGTL